MAWGEDNPTMAPSAIISNSFSLGMLNELGGRISVEKSCPKEIMSYALTSVVGHEATAQVFSAILGSEIPVNRQQLTDFTGIIFVGQLMARLPEGKILSTEEMRQISIRWFKVTIEWNTACWDAEREQQASLEAEEDRQAEQKPACCQACAFASIFGSAGELKHTC